jgi:hypothetical protein
MSRLNHPLNHESEPARWAVEFTGFRTWTDEQQAIIESFDVSLRDEIVEAFVQAATPGGYIVGSAAGPGKIIAFPSRATGRHFISVFGGRWLPPAS